MKSVLNCSETMRVLQVSRDTVHKMLAHGQLKGFRCGKVVRIDGQSVDRLLGREEAANKAVAVGG